MTHSGTDGSDPSRADARNSHASSADAGDTGPITLSTGETVDLPLSVEGTAFGAVFAAPRKRVAELLPDGLRPIRATASGKAAVSLQSIEYRRIGDGEIDPYNEFMVALPAVHDTGTTLPYLSALTRASSGYVWFLPVTTEPAKALGVDVWGLPKVLADITHEDDGARRKTTVTVDGERFVTFEATRPPTMETQDDSYTYSSKNGELVCIPAEAGGEMGAWPFSDAVSVSLGEHPRADRLRRLDLGDRALARVFTDGWVDFHAGEPVAPD